MTEISFTVNGQIMSAVARTDGRPVPSLPIQA